MSYPISACCFIRNTFRGAFMLPETMAQFLPLVDEMVIMDLGSDDDTIEFLYEVSGSNPKVKVILEQEFPFTDANVFATLANELVRWCRYDNVLYWQADEVWHEDLLELMANRFELGLFDLSFWRIQFRENFQVVKWFPHLVHRVGQKGKFEFNGDGMNTTRTWDAKICSNYGGEYFPQWGEMGQDGIKPYTNEMATDVSLVGGFLENIPERRAMHAPFWHETIDIEGVSQDIWMERERQNPNWYKKESPFNLPAILKYHLGKVRYELRSELLEALKSDKTEEYLVSLI